MAFELPDGALTPTGNDPAVLHLHATRRAHLRAVIEGIPGAARMTPLDLASREGFSTVELARRRGRPPAIPPAHPHHRRRHQGLSRLTAAAVSG